MTHPLQEMAGCPIELVWHENHSSYLTVSKKRGILKLRVHRLFYDAPTPVLQALIKYAKVNDSESRAVIRQMAHLYFSNTICVEKKPLQSKGEVYDLQEIFNLLFELFPEEKPQDVSIGWSNRKSTGKSSITFGTFDKHCRRIRINSILDDSRVPQYFLEYIVYHEMLHAVCPSRMDTKGRCSVHTKEFREKEKLFPHYLLAREWEKKSLSFFKRRRHGRS